VADLRPDRYIEASELGLELYRGVAELPIVSPHGHIDVQLFADPAARLDPPGRLFVTASGAYIRLLGNDDMVEVAGFANWTLRCRGDGPPSTEAYMHYLLNKEVGAKYVVHNHYIPGARLENLDVPMVPPKEYGSIELAEAAAQAARKHHVFYVRRHGLVFWATDFDQCLKLIGRVAEGMTLLRQQ